ncbi:hypothetical protein Ato02nite_002290 [Paractinoplanes toevensis]|uniref:Uncharacterized protein n=1 Tax=Paractinoplanes toevensis TaxID=571911 RepID=A0A919T6F0_9ACTN|nr:hypothetical protein Ato02nite_002290 [Actinoplanes toevensis]
MKRELLVSLSHVNDPATTTVYPGDPPFELETVATIEKDGYCTRYVRQGEDTGTHRGPPGTSTRGLSRPAGDCRSRPGGRGRTASPSRWARRRR